MNAVTMPRRLFVAYPVAGAAGAVLIRTFAGLEPGDGATVSLAAVALVGGAGFGASQALAPGTLPGSKQSLAAHVAAFVAAVLLLPLVVWLRHDARTDLGLWFIGWSLVGMSAGFLGIAVGLSLASRKGRS